MPSFWAAINNYKPSARYADARQRLKNRQQASKNKVSPVLAEVAKEIAEREMVSKVATPPSPPFLVRSRKTNSKKTTKGLCFFFICFRNGY